MTLKKFALIFILPITAFGTKAQTANCIFKPPQFTIHFGTGNVRDPNSTVLNNYRRVNHSCPSDGYYSFTSYTSDCFSDDWHTISEDHTAGDVNGNMLLVNAARNGGVFLSTPVPGLKSNTTYEIGFWVINLCKPTKKCPYLLLPNLSIQLQTPEGRVVASIATGDLPRIAEPRWTQHRATFTAPASNSILTLVMMDNVPSGCGNDFALDDITFRECVKQNLTPATAPKTTQQKKQATTTKPVTKKNTIVPKKDEAVHVTKPKVDSATKSVAVIKQQQKIFPPAPLVLKTRENELARKIETEAGEFRIDIYDNGQIDGDTVSIYHNNVLIKSRQRLSQKPISFTIKIDKLQAHHEIVMVAENLGSIPPNTSVMVISTVSRRYEVFISSSEQKNAKVVLDFKK